jgi:Zn-dependent protease with chaperone function
MARVSGGVVAWLLFVVAPTAAAASDDQSAVEEQIIDQLAASSPEAAELFEQATRARDEGKLESALELYQKAAAAAPASDHPIRRRCGLLSRMQRHDDAVAECERALAIQPDSPLDQGAMAMALASRGAPGDAVRALPLARRAAEAMPDDERIVATWCGVTLEAGSSSQLQECAPRLLALDPEGAVSNYVGAIASADRGDDVAARRYLERARDGGLDDATYRQLKAAIGGEESHGGGAGVLRTALWVAGGWLAGLVVLLVTGWILSRLTLRAVDRVTASGDRSGHGSSREKTLRRVYRFVVLLSGLWFYLSVPILLATVLVAGGGLIWVFIAAGHIPVKLVLLIGVGVVVTIGAILRSLFVRSGDGELGLAVDLEKNPRFRDLLADVARTVGTRPVDNAYLTPTTDMAVTERGGLWKAVSGRSRERCLIVGVGLLDGMKEIELRSVLAHEYGHFRNADTAGGGFALAVRRSLGTMIVHLARSGAATWYNPVWWMLRFYLRVYLVVTQGASRLQEVLADRWAVSAYGSDAFVRGYTHVVERSVRFDRHLDATLKEVIEAERPLPNLYRYQPAATAEPGDEKADIEEAMAREPSAYDSHPAPRQRIAWARALACPREPHPDDDRSVWDLFADREALEARMTARVREALAANHGVAIAG